MKNKKHENKMKKTKTPKEFKEPVPDEKQNQTCMLCGRTCTYLSKQSMCKACTEYNTSLPTENKLIKD